MEKKSDGDEEELSIHKIKPKSPSVPVDKDPVKEQRRKDVVRKKKANITAEEEETTTKIEPTLSTRIGLQDIRESKYVEGQPRPQYIIPKTKKQRKILERNRANTAKKFCKYGSVKVPDPIPSRKLEIRLDVPSPEGSSAKVAPRKVTPSPSWLYPYPQTKDELDLKKPKSGIFINEKQQEGESLKDYDSFNLVYTRTPRPQSPTRPRKTRRKPGKDELDDILEDDEEVSINIRKKRKKRRKDKSKTRESTEKAEEEFSIMEDDMANEMFGEDMGKMEDYLTRQFRRKVSQISHTTSYQNQDVQSFLSEKEIPEEVTVSRYIQKFRRESEIKRYEPKKRKFKRGTLESHSFTDVHQPTLKDFFFGSKEGTIHQGDNSFAASLRNNQGICMSVAAYCYSILKHPNKWTSENIDEILGYGNQLCTESAKKRHIHNLTKELKPQKLQKYCVIGEKKIRFTVGEPEVSGYIRSDDKRVYNLTKALKIFFARNSSGILKTQDVSIAIWKHKYYYMFDAKPRTKDLYVSLNGTAIMANFYDIISMATVFLERSNFGNWPFVIYPLKALRILNRDDLEVDSNAALDVLSNYNILNESKAVVMGSFDLADKCFDFSRNKQSLAMAVVCLVYSRITPPSAWHKTVIDKIMIIGNQLYLECIQCESVIDLRLDNLPSMFTLGPYIIEIYIYANVFADFMYKSCCCQLNCSLDEFFDKCTNAIVQIGKSHLAVWKQRNMYFCFDPYSRNTEGFRCRDGAACVSMHSNLESLVATVATNFDSKDTIFYVHALKVCKIHRDPIQSSRFPKHLTMDDFPVEEFKMYKMRKSRKAATEKPVTVDYSALAMRRLMAGEHPEESIFEIGSTVESLGMEQIPPMVHKFPSRSILKAHPKQVDVVADLDSPSLSDTQIEPSPPPQPNIVEEIELQDYDSFDLTMEEIEMQEISPEDGYYMAEGYEEGENYEMEGWEATNEELEEGGMEQGEGIDDWFFSANQYSQVGQYSLLTQEMDKISEQVNTDITYFPIKKEILYPTYLRGKQKMKYRLQRYKFTEDNWDDYMPPEPEVTMSQELKKETNFVDLPDDTQIILGTKNVADFGKDVEFIAPFVCIMAGVVSRKYSILTWTEEIVDYILKCGNELYSASKFRYDQVSKLEIPKVTLGNTIFTVLVEYIFDTYTRQNILELAIDKILFVRSGMGVLVTPTYACALFQKNHLYYMYDCFGNNEVGLSEGPTNTGTACFSRFKDVRSLAARIMYNKRKRESSEEVVYSRFVLSSVKVKEIRVAPGDRKREKKKPKKATGVITSTTDDEEVGIEMEGEDEYRESEPATRGTDDEEVKGEEKENEKSSRKREKSPKNKVGYQYRKGIYTIEGTKALVGRKTLADELKIDHFVCLCACLMLMSCPVSKWDTKKVDQVIDNGNHVYSHAGDLEISEKRTIKNVLVEKNFFDIIVKMIKIENWKSNKNLNAGIDTLLAKKLTYFLVQFPNACYVVHKSLDGCFHLFDPYGVPNSSKAGWVRYRQIKTLKWRLKNMIISGGESYTFYNFEVTSIQKAPKDILISHKLQEYDMALQEWKEHLGKPFYEDVEWLKTDPVPWSRKLDESASGKDRGTVDNRWHNWDKEYPKDLFSLMGNIHQFSERFSRTTRGKQTLANLVVAIGMMEIYDLAEWNSAVVDSVLVNGNNYFEECVKDISEENYELSIDDLKDECSIFPFSFKVAFTPVVEGTMFLVRVAQFNLYKALRYFFERVDRRCGIICAAKSERKRQVSFGKLRESEYFMFDCDCLGAPMFLENHAVAYILRTTTLNRLLHVLTLTLRGGDFYIYDVEISDLKPIS